MRLGNIHLSTSKLQQTNNYDWIRRGLGTLLCCLFSVTHGGAVCYAATAQLNMSMHQHPGEPDAFDTVCFRSHAGELVVLQAEWHSYPKTWPGISAYKKDRDRAQNLVFGLCDSQASKHPRFVLLVESPGAWRTPAGADITKGQGVDWGAILRGKEAYVGKKTESSGVIARLHKLIYQNRCPTPLLSAELEGRTLTDAEYKRVNDESHLDDVTPAHVQSTLLKNKYYQSLREENMALNIIKASEHGSSSREHGGVIALMGSIHVEGVSKKLESHGFSMQMSCPSEITAYFRTPMRTLKTAEGVPLSRHKHYTPSSASGPTSRPGTPTPLSAGEPTSRPDTTSHPPVPE